MSNPWQSQVNQKLYFSQLLVTDACAQSGAAAQALLEGALWHLVTAYRFYLREIAQQQRHNLDALDARDARRQLAEKGFVCQELDYLAQLEVANEWPARLLRECRKITGEEIVRKDIARKETARTEIESSQIRNSPNSLAVTDITEMVDIETCQNWLGQFQQLVATQRDSAQEC